MLKLVTKKQIKSYLFCVGLGILGGIVRKLAATAGCLDAWGFKLSEFELKGHFSEEKEGDGGRTLACAITLSQTESIKEMAKRSAVNDFMVFVDFKKMAFNFPMLWFQ